MWERPAWLVCGALASSTFAMPARAAELHVTAPAACAPETQVETEVERLTGRALRDVTGIDFELRIEQAATHDWRLVLRTVPVDAAKQPRRRELAGASCEDVTAAAAIAIAMTIEGRDESAIEPQDDTAARHPGPDRETQSRTASTRTLRPGVDAGAIAAEPTGGSTAWRFGVAAAVMLDAGALPALAPGVALELSANVRMLRLAAFGALFPAQHARLAGSARGGEFQLAVGGALACAQPSFAPWFALGCAGIELGQLSAKGEGATVSAALTDAFWSAARIEAGLGVEPGSGFRVLARGGVALPFARPEFVLNGREHVHRAASVTARVLLALELML